MKFVVTGEDQVFGPWFADKTGGVWVPGKGSTIGLMDDGKGIQACSYYEAFNGRSIMMHCAGEGKSWLNREFLWFSFFYPFQQLQVSKIISPVDSENSDCIRFIKHIGFTLEATLEAASPKGDILLFTMTKDQCKWLDLRGGSHRKAQSPTSTGL